MATSHTAHKKAFFGVLVGILDFITIFAAPAGIGSLQLWGKIPVLYQRVDTVRLIVTVAFVSKLFTMAILPHSTPVVAQEPAATDTTLPNGALDDRLIMFAVDDELRRSEAVDGHLIDVNVDEGIVTLSGRINHLLTQRIAVGLAERIRGVVAVIDEMEINISDFDDAQTKLDVTAALKNEPATERLDLDVNVERGVVTLTGNVANTGQRTFAGEITMSVKGVLELKNDVTVEPTTLTPKEMAAEIEGLIRYATFLDDCAIEVDVADDQAVLTGRVASAAQKSYAALQAYHAGARRVDTRGIRVDWRHTNPELRKSRHTNITDDELKQAIERAFRHDPRLLSFDPVVEVSHRIVTLTGNVGNLTAKQAAEHDAQQTIGVRQVKNNLKIRFSDTRPTDQEIATNTRAAMARDPYVNGHNLKIDCENAHVGIYGLVDTDFEKYHAQWVASRQRGVVHVNDYLGVRKKWVPKPDAAIETELKEKLAYDFVGPDNQVRSRVENGVAILEGTVDTWFMWQAAMDDAIACGAREPHNLIEVRHGAAASPRYYGPSYYIPR